MKREVYVFRKVVDETGFFVDVRTWEEQQVSVRIEFDVGSTALVSAEFARQLGKALIACADEVEGRS